MVRLQRVFASLCITAVVLPGALAAPAAAEWKRLDSPNFVVVGDVGAGDPEHRAQVRSVPRNIEPGADTGRDGHSLPTVVMVFPSDNTFTPFKRRQNGKPVGMTGLFMPRQYANYIAIVRDLNENAMRGVFHEYAHLLISNISDIVRCG